MSKLRKFIFGNRVIISGLLILLQIGLLIYGLLVLDALYTSIISIVAIVLDVLLILSINNREMVNEAKYSWMIVVLVIPFIGCILYLIFSKHSLSIIQRKKLSKIIDENLKYIKDEDDISSIPHEYRSQFQYLKTVGDYNSYLNNNVKFYKKGEFFLEDYLNELKKAEKFIFIEYFIIGLGKAWDQILQVLVEKVHQGVEVRVLYDDFGSAKVLPKKYYKTLRNLGIKSYAFNRLVPIASSVHNNRDHRKITVIDAKVAFTGGLNLSDEYFNIVKEFGDDWKDTAVKIEGSAVNAYTRFFLACFDLVSETNEDFDKYINKEPAKFENNGVICPYADGPRPIYDNYIGEDVYLNLINSANNYIYITSPYLICDEVLKKSLIRASERGVDVRIIIPGVPDKKLVYMITRNTCYKLAKKGINIYTYKNGFIHSKQFLVDGKIGSVGTINLDYRSLIHHYEDGILMYNTDSLVDMKEDFEETFIKSDLINDYKQNIFKRFICFILNIFQPLM